MEIMDEKFNVYAIVELFGHQRMAGTVSEQNFGGSVFLRVDVPETKTQPKFTRILNPSAIYAINPVTHEVMVQMANMMETKPIDSWDIQEVNRKIAALLPNNEE